MSGCLEQNKAETALAAYLRGGRLPHALLLEGSGDKTAFAKQVAQGALCTQSPETRPCGQCKDCKKVEKDIHPDVLFYAGSGGNLSFHVDTVRELRREAFVRPNEGRCKVLVLKEVQEMTPQAQNALLKILEEPPKNVTFILTCENRAALLETILSRATVLPLGGAQPAAMEDALAIAEQLICGSELSALAAFCAYEKDKQAAAEILENLASLIRALLRPEDGQNFLYKRLQMRATALQLMQFLAIIEEAAAANAQNVSRPLVFSNLCACVKLALDGEIRA